MRPLVALPNLKRSILKDALRENETRNVALWRIAAAFGLLAFTTPGASGIVRMIPIYGQILHASGPLPSFEVATIRPWKPMPRPPLPPSDGSTVPPKMIKASPVGGGGQPTDRVHFIGQTALLIASAYNLPVGSESRRIIGVPDWLNSEADRYEVKAKIEDSQYAAMQKMTPAQQREQVALLEQSLLTDRFKLKIHFEAREMPIYALVLAKSGPKLTPAKDDEASKLSSLYNQQGSEITAQAVTLDQFVHSPLWTPIGGRLVMDQTGLKGTYDFTLKWTSELLVTQGVGQEIGADTPSLFTAIQEQLGLKLVPTKGPVEVIVIDHIERPSEN
jgi:bla regulator protein blaR1